MEPSLTPRLKWRYFVTLLREEYPDGDQSQHLSYSFYGSTCDGLDYMPGPFSLPNDVTVGDHIRIVGIGAYGCTLRTAFNGFNTYETFNMSEDPSTYDLEISSPLSRM